MIFFRNVLLATLLTPLLLTAQDRPNVLFIAADDLRPLLGCYGDPHVQTPNLDQLAEEAMLFERAYCQLAKCGPSRASILSGYRPETLGFYAHSTRDLKVHDQLMEGKASLPTHFKAHGYDTRSFGKIAHDGWEKPDAWSTLPAPGRDGEMLETVDPASIEGMAFEERVHVETIISSRHACPVLQAPDVPDETLFDARTTSRAIAELAEVDDQPFFFAVGFRRPHLPFVAPKKYFDLYPLNPDWLPENRTPARGAPIMAVTNSDGYGGMARRFDREMPVPPPSMESAIAWNGMEMRSYLGVPLKGELSEQLQMELWQAYLACVTYVDAQVGRLLAALEENGQRENTIVVFWSDHGWHLGEQSAWGKMTNFEIATRVPLIIDAPELPEGRTESLAELVDLYPTLCDLTGLDLPAHLEGESLVPALKGEPDPQGDVALSQYERYRTHMGRALRTDRFRYVEWSLKKDGKIVERELYDHDNDPNETVNQASNPEMAPVMEELSARLKKEYGLTE